MRWFFLSIGDVTISAAVAWIIAAAAGLTAVFKAVEILQRIFGKGKKAVEERLHKHDELLENDNKRLKAIEKALEVQQGGQAVQCRALLGLINHQLSGNDVDKLRGARDELLTFLTER